MAENVTLEKVLLGDTTKEYVDKVNKAIENVNSNADAIENLTGAVANAGKVDDVKVNDISVVSNKIANVKVNGSDTVKVETSGTGEITISAPTLAKSLTLSVDPSTYVLTATLKDSNENALSTQTVDLPLETMVVGASYDESTKEIILTLQDRTQTRFSVADLVSGLVATDNNFTDGQVLIADGNGKKAKSSGYTIKKSVPADAKFTDTTYDPATTSKSGLMSAADKAKLDRIDSSLEGVTADQIGKVKDVQVNGTSVLGSDGVATITIDDLKAEYVSVQSSSLVNCVVDGTTYKAIKVADTDTELEVYNSDGNKILTHTVRKDGFLYICVGTTAISCTLRKINGNSIGTGGSSSVVKSVELVNGDALVNFDFLELGKLYAVGIAGSSMRGFHGIYWHLIRVGVYEFSYNDIVVSHEYSLHINLESVAVLKLSLRNISNNEQVEMNATVYFREIGSSLLPTA